MKSLQPNTSDDDRFINMLQAPFWSSYKKPSLWKKDEKTSFYVINVSKIY